MEADQAEKFLVWSEFVMWAGDPTWKGYLVIESSTKKINNLLESLVLYLEEVNDGGKMCLFHTRPYTSIHTF